MLNVLVPMAGSGRRFQEAGYDRPKPLLLIHGRTMIELVVANVTPRRPHRFIFLCQRQHLDGFGLRELLHAVTGEALILEVAELTEGTACTALLARDHIDNDDPLMI